MGKRRRKKHFSRSEREALRSKAEQEKQGLGGVPGLRRPRPGTRHWTQHKIAESCRYDPQHLINNFCGKMVKVDRNKFGALIEAVLTHRPGLIDRPYLGGLIQIARARWDQRTLAEWRPKGRGLSMAYRSLAEHLLARYPIPPFLWDVILIDASQNINEMRAIRFAAHIAQGNSSRGVVGTKLIPAPLTRRMLHILTNLNRPMPFAQMVRLAQVSGYGGSEQLAHHLAGTRLAGFISGEHYWATVIHWLCRHPDLDPDDLGPIIDYLHFKFNEGSGVEMSGRTPESIKRAMASWHQELADLRSFRLRVFIPSGFKSHRWKKILRCGNDQEVLEIWTMKEILTAKALVAEGRSMRHCVASYREGVAEGIISIWSLARDDRRRLTIEVRNGHRAVTQVRGRANRLPNPAECKYIRSWARRNGLTVRSHEMSRVATGAGDG